MHGPYSAGQISGVFTDWYQEPSPFEDLSDIGSPRADDHELLELPYIPEDPYFEAAHQAPPSPDHVPGPEEPGHAPPSPDYVPGPEHDDAEIVAEGPAEHLAPAYPVVVALPATAPSAEETEPFETDESAATPPPHPAYRMTARISIPEPLPVPAWSDSEVARLLANFSPPDITLSPWSHHTTGFLSHYHHLPYPTSFPTLLLPTGQHTRGRPEVKNFPLANFKTTTVIHASIKPHLMRQCMVEMSITIAGPRLGDAQLTGPELIKKKLKRSS
ncbi:hypothetical protein Tco_0649547 [Tanacetum coccineum]